MKCILGIYLGMGIWNKYVCVLCDIYIKYNNSKRGTEFEKEWRGT